MVDADINSEVIKMTSITSRKKANLSLREINKSKWITATAVFMGMNIALCAFGIPVPGGHLYLNDVVICTASLLLDPVGAFIVGGIGAFLGDFIFYPVPMFVSLAAHGLQAAVISMLFHSLFPGHRRLSIAQALLGMTGSMLLCFRGGILDSFSRIMRE